MPGTAKLHMCYVIQSLGKPHELGIVLIIPILEEGIKVE